MDRLAIEELYVFIDTIIYMGVYEEPRIGLYWNTDFNKGPLHLISKYVSLCHFKQIKRYCHISCPEQDQKEYYLPKNKI